MKDNKSEPRPLTRAELLDWLKNIEAMHVFSKGVDFGGEAYRSYVEGMAGAAKFIRDCVEKTPVIR